MRSFATLPLALLPFSLLPLTGCGPIALGHIGGEDTSPTVEEEPDADGDGFVESKDCDDTDKDVNPDADEVCDEVDNDCDDEVDEDATDAGSYYTDADGDGFGDDATATQGCTAPAGAATVGGDCDDNDDAVSPAAFELCNGADDNCDNKVDNDAVDAELFTAPDADEDGYGSTKKAKAACELAEGYTEDTTDCDDSDALVNPAAIEICNGVDDDCEGTTDEGAVDVSSWYTDADADGYGGAEPAILACEAPAGTVAIEGDCDDAVASRYPGSPELCNYADDDCNGLTDDNATDATVTTAPDADSDGYGDSSAAALACSLASGFVTDTTDCDDSDPSVNPGASEVCDELDVDEDCDSLADDDDSSVSASSLSTWYEDPDGNGYGTSSTTLSQCEQPADYVAALATAADSICSSGVWAAGTSDAGTVSSTDFDFGPSDSYTVRFVANLDDSASGSVLVKGDNSSNEWSISMSTTGVADTTTLCFNRQGLSNIACVEASAGSFHDYVVEYDVGTVTWVVDGITAGYNFGSVGTAVAGSALTVGNYPGDTQPAVGEFDEIAVWSRALTLAEIVDLSTGAAAATDYSGNVAWWRFDEGSGSVAADLSGSANDIALSGPTWAADCY